MTAQPLPLSETSFTEAGYHPNPSDAVRIHSAAELLFRSLQDGTALTADMMRCAMKDAFGTSDAEGAWIWKDAYEAAEAAQIMMLNRFGSVMRRHAKSPAQFISMISRLAELVPTQTRRSEDMVALQQFSTPLPLAAIAAQAADISSSDLVLEPSAGTGILASFAEAASGRIVLNELSSIRRELLALLFPDATVTGHDAASIDDRLDRSVTPSVVLMNPPFSVAHHVEGRFKTATANHVLSALARLKPGGRLVAITGSNFNPASKPLQSAFARLNELGQIVLSAPIAGRVFARHGTNVETRLTVIDKHVDALMPETKPSAFFPLMEGLDELGELVYQETPPRLSLSATPPPAVSLKSTVMSVRDAARAQVKASEVERQKHPFDTAETIELHYEIQGGTDRSGKISDNVYEPYALQSIRIDGVREHPTALVQSAAMA